MGGAESTVVAPVDDPERDGMGEGTPPPPKPAPPPATEVANVVVELLCWCWELLLNQDSDIGASSPPLTPIFLSYIIFLIK